MKIEFVLKFSIDHKLTLMINDTDFIKMEASLTDVFSEPFFQKQIRPNVKFCPEITCRCFFNVPQTWSYFLCARFLYLILRIHQ